MLLEYHPPIDPWLSILYQDDHIVVVNKQPGILSVSGNKPQFIDSIIHRLQQKFSYVESVHRLDMATSGIMVAALSKLADREIKKQFRERIPKKNYIAVVYGHIKEDSGQVELPLICDWPNRPRQMVDLENGKPALTLYQVISRNPDNTTRVSLSPFTGRSHQLRVHMQALGHPILGDKFYAHPEAFSRSKRLLLHAQSLTILHPKTGESMTFNCDPDF
ncbi:bifunctional tRNA pseudouridine(32) synthase/23S rRNA pseudouridine(746) synthase RluA [Gilliamella sp. B3791]|uniref:bifunctional tRNA pseudouridine(32) synthase/23S rRNA pseudouridine(746) synthase RluA n=1 Tax=unclassified Gilliamella TaxID=2685620 RepID=UPI00226ADE4A|nr:MULTISPECIES: bifunctional tRNA pseudouridine(32) synthase/23S rRNA pseudouridine(746) synthase RluA [unclassified Gilliamella]MCX8642995.1 bifunctional tRNA pseudouridine(32) synthase/23S rRNA pseudouridine(746) synthase RluA [Gilliamella sp. B3835]MCX8708386.1 bifunctional tRNA pseudouridine(32) synthase/23S rRNA pseudouridine(746) synthase RluA [Gilliamella sp. B3783]MCX8709868.1 bifunctional tRNA pseudouridine(32) synthase/23S rRNA pseudouridine(746) synthase RluA [Gilliamella sp. B3780]